ncbi:MAG: 50S ribosomal protein L29 [Candidatus Aerophobetes bacterium]|nr:50S ribosomal protein L29 [Candidatus Aerophobetes bacterium]
MNIMKIDELRDLSEVDLRQHLKELKKELLNVKIQIVQGRMTNSSKVKEFKKAVARVSTLLREKENS